MISPVQALVISNLGNNKFTNGGKTLSDRIELNSDNLAKRGTVSRSIGLARIIRNDDGTSTGVWGVYTLQSAFQPIFAFNHGRLSVAAFEGLIRPFRDGLHTSDRASLLQRQSHRALIMHVEALTRRFTF
jgi:hypothetical protein